MEEIIKDFLISKNICKIREKIKVISEYRSDNYPQVYKITDYFAKIEFKIRITLNRPNAVATEKQVLNILKNEIKQKFYPNLYAEYKNQPIIGDVLIIEYIPGHTLAMEIDKLTPKEERLIVNKLSNIIQNMHNIRNKYFTLFDGIECTSWTDIYRYKLESFIDFSYKNNIIDKSLKKEIDVLCKSVQLENIEPILVHYDIKPDNIIINDIHNKISLIDFEIARFVDPFMEYSKGEFLCYLFKNKKYRNNIWIPFVETMTNENYYDILKSRKMKLYTIYHHMSYINHIWTLESKLETGSLTIIQKILGEF